MKLTSGSVPHDRMILCYTTGDGQYQSRGYFLFVGSDYYPEARTRRPILYYGIHENDYDWHLISGFSGTTLNDNVWHHIVVTVEQISDTFTIKMYIDGNLDSKSPQYIYAPHSAYGLERIGLSAGNWPAYALGDWAGDWSLLGDIDTTMIWDRPITATEVAALWNGGAGRDCT